MDRYLHRLPRMIRTKSGVDDERQAIEQQLVLHVDSLAGLIGPRTLGKPKTIEATLGYIRPFDQMRERARRASL